MPNSFLPSLLDRLRTESPRVVAGSSFSHGIGIADYRQMVIRDLTNLLNHSSFFISGGETVPANGASHARFSSQLFPTVAESVLNYGVDLPSGMLISGNLIETLRRNIREAIECFEPRLRNVRVQFSKTSSEEGSETSEKRDWGKLWFLIEADLIAEPFPVAIQLKTELDLISGECAIPEADTGITSDSPGGKPPH